MQSEFELEAFSVKFSRKAKNSGKCYIDTISFSDKWSTIEFMARKSNKESLEKIQNFLDDFHCWINHKPLKPYKTLNKFLFDIETDDKKNKITMKIGSKNYSKDKIFINIKDLLTYSPLLFNEEMLNEIVRQAPKNSDLDKVIPESHTYKPEDNQHTKTGYIKLN
jgi:hypothetical protein